MANDFSLEAILGLNTSDFENNLNALGQTLGTFKKTVEQEWQDLGEIYGKTFEQFDQMGEALVELGQDAQQAWDAFPDAPPPSLEETKQILAEFRARPLTADDLGAEAWNQMAEESGRAATETASKFEVLGRTALQIGRNAADGSINFERLAGSVASAGARLSNYSGQGAMAFAGAASAIVMSIQVQTKAWEEYINQVENAREALADETTAMLARAAQAKKIRDDEIIEQQIANRTKEERRRDLLYAMEKYDDEQARRMKQRVNEEIEETYKMDREVAKLRLQGRNAEADDLEKRMAAHRAWFDKLVEEAAKAAAKRAQAAKESADKQIAEEQRIVNETREIKAIQDRDELKRHQSTLTDLQEILDKEQELGTTAAAAAAKVWEEQTRTFQALKNQLINDINDISGQLKALAGFEMPLVMGGVPLPMGLGAADVLRQMLNSLKTPGGLPVKVMNPTPPAAAPEPTTTTPSDGAYGVEGRDVPVGPGPEGPIQMAAQAAKNLGQNLKKAEDAKDSLISDIITRTPDGTRAIENMTYAVNDLKKAMSETNFYVSPMGGVSGGGMGSRPPGQPELSAPPMSPEDDIAANINEFIRNGRTPENAIAFFRDRLTANQITNLLRALHTGRQITGQDVRNANGPVRGSTWEVGTTPSGAFGQHGAGRDPVTGRFLDPGSHVSSYGSPMTMGFLEGPDFDPGNAAVQSLVASGNLGDAMRENTKAVKKLTDSSTKQTKATEAEAMSLEDFMARYEGGLALPKVMEEMSAYLKKRGQMNVTLNIGKVAGQYDVKSMSNQFAKTLAITANRESLAV